MTAYLAAAARRHTCATVLFIDGKAAYYSVIRQCLLSHSHGEDLPFLEDLLHKLGFTPEQQAALLAALQGKGILAEAGVPTALQSFLRSSLQGTCFTMGAGGEDTLLVLTHSGTVPGTPLADCLFAFAQSKFQKEVQQELVEEGLAAYFGHRGPAPLPSWADDVSILLPFCHAAEVRTALTKVVQIVEHHSRAIGVELNFDKGKTEALCAFRGPGSKAVRRELLSSDCPSIPVTLRSGQVANLRLVESYAHLGSVVNHAASPVGDIRAKVQAAMPCLERLRRTLLRNQELSSTEKIELVRSLIIAKVSYGSAIWCPTTAQEENACCMAFGKIWRQALRPILGLSSLYLDDDEVCGLLGVLTPQQSLAVERIRQLTLVVKHGPSFLWACLLAEGKWLAHALQALRVVTVRLRITDIECSAVCEQTLLALRDQITRLYSLPRRFGKQVLQDRCCDKIREQATLRTRWESEGWIPITLATEARSVEFACVNCRATFSTKAALASHQASRHGVKLVCHAVSGSACPVCRQEWWTTFRLREHLRRAPQCRASWNEVDLPTAQSFEHTGSRADRAWRPPVEVEGPQPFWATLNPPAPPAHTAADVAPNEAIRPEGIHLRQLEELPKAGDLGKWFVQIFQAWNEHAASFSGNPFTAGTVAADAWALCAQTIGMPDGSSRSCGRLSFLLEERKRFWLKLSP